MKKSRKRSVLIGIMLLFLSGLLTFVAVHYPLGVRVSFSRRYFGVGNVLLNFSVLVFMGAFIYLLPKAREKILGWKYEQDGFQKVVKILLLGFFLTVVALGICGVVIFLMHYLEQTV